MAIKIKKNHWAAIILAVLAVARGAMYFCGWDSNPEDEFRKANPQVKLAPPPPKAPVAAKPTVAAKPEPKAIAGVKQGEFKLKVNLPQNPETLVRYLIPVDADGKPVASAANMVVYCPFNGNANSIERRLSDWLTSFATELRCSFFTLTIKVDKTDDHGPKYYINPEVGWDKVILDIQDRLCREFKLPVRPLLLVGESSGTSMAEMLLSARPDRVDAVAGCGGAVYRPLPKGAVNKPVLLLSTWGCPGENSSREFALANHTPATPVFNTQTPPDFKIVEKVRYHAPGDLAYQMIRRFIGDMIAMREANGGKIPPLSQWPGGMPSPEFAAMWETLPHGNVEFYTRTDHPPILLVIAMEDYPQQLIRAEDCLYSVRDKAVSVRLRPGPSAIEDTANFEAELRKILADPRYRDLPVVLFGHGLAGQALAIAAKRVDDPRIRRMTGVNMAEDYPFSELSLRESCQNPKFDLKLVNLQQSGLPYLNILGQTLVESPVSTGK